MGMPSIKMFFEPTPKNVFQQYRSFSDIRQTVKCVTERRLIAFSALVIVGSLGVIPAPLLKGVSRRGLVTAIAVPGMKTSLKAMADVDGLATSLIVSETVFLAISVLTIVVLLYRGHSDCRALGSNEGPSIRKRVL